jgi:hypothetical protein
MCSIYAKGNTLFGFDLTPDMSEVGTFQLIKQGNLRVEIHFAEALTATINVVTAFSKLGCNGSAGICRPSMFSATKLIL